MLKIGQVVGADSDEQGEFTEGSPLKSIPATKVKSEWLNEVQRELVNLLEKNGVIVNPDSDQQIYDLLNRATPLRTNAIPIARVTPGVICFPEMLTPDGCWQVIDNKNGTITLPEEQSFIWRGLWEMSTSSYGLAERTFSTLANKTYHLRWSIDHDFVLYDLADKSYNPSSLAEDHAAFDSSYDNMLIARVVTNATNICTITLFKNQVILHAPWEIAVTAVIRSIGDGSFRALKPLSTLVLNWARTPKAYFSGASGFNLGNQYRSSGFSNDNAFGITVTRNQADFYDYYEAGKAELTTWSYYLRSAG